MSFDLPRIQKSTRRVEKFLRKNSRRPSAEAIHDLRTDSRRLETAFVTLNLNSKANVKRLLRELGDVRKRAGKVRDMDVLTAAAVTVQHEREQNCLVRLLEHLGAERGKQVKKLRSRVDAANPRLMRRIDRTSKRVEKLLKRAKEDPADSTAVPVTVAKAIELGADLKTPATLTRANLHEYRLKVKELRNVLQLANQPDNQKFVGDLTEVKDAIGEWHDWQELSGIANQVLDHTPCKLRSTLKAMTDAKYKHALRLSNQLRDNYLDSGRPKRGRKSIKKSARPDGFLDATAAIAEG